MYAIIETGGKQYKVEPGQVIMVEKIKAEEGEEIRLCKVLAVVGDDKSVTTGSPVENAVVVAKVVSHGKAPKIRGFKFKAKSNYRKRYGHRQPFTKISIEKIEVGA